MTHIGETFRNEEEEKEERGIAVTWQLNHPLKSRSDVRERGREGGREDRRKMEGKGEEGVDRKKERETRTDGRVVKERR